MKRILLSTAALAGLALVAAAPARAEDPALSLGLGGYINGYAMHTSQDEPVGTEYRSFDLRKDTSIALTGEVALDNGITAGAYIEMWADRFDTSQVQESYLYLSSSWGRVNIGEEDGIAYLLQVTAPSADENIDGVRPYIGTFAAATGGTISYAHDNFGFTNKLTYITPVFNGFQGGVSLTPSASEGDLDGNAAAAVANSVGTNLENAWELAARYEGNFEALDIALGAGYSKASQEHDAAGEDDSKVWNAGLSLGWGAFGAGVSYLTDNNASDNNDTDTWVVGLDYTTGPYKLGASYLNQENENATNDEEIDRWTVGAIYEWGPGMTFRGSVQFQDAEDVGGVATADADGTQIGLGTQLNF